jgi:tRNA(Arg) A34 adenosine deaminase TadA
MQLPIIHIEYPPWIKQMVDWDRHYINDEEKMRLAIELSRENILQKTGGPFASAIFEIDSGKLVAVGINMVVPLNNSILHGEIVAFMMAQTKLKSFTLSASGMPSHEIFTTCDPCAMCLGAILWSGVKRVVCGASREDAQRLNFDEGPVFEQSYDYLKLKGIEVIHNVCQQEANAVLSDYVEQGGLIYNGKA